MSEQFTKVNGGLLVRAPGKINLSLLVAGKRPDGYHDIETLMAKIDWFDEILIERKTEDRGQRTDDGGRRTEYRGQNDEIPTSNTERRTKEKPVIELICKGAYKVPEGEENLVYKAAEEILKIENKKAKSKKPGFPAANQMSSRSEAGRTEDGRQKTESIRLTLTKHIPAGSGLGSGSSDAAATLMGINKFFKMGLGKRELAGLAAKLGSDIAFFLNGPMALCTGRGEKIKKLAECEFRVFVIIPDVTVSTKRVYENYRHDETRYRRLREEINVYIEKKRLDLVCSLCANMLQESCFELHPELKELKKRIESLGIRPVCLSGSGSSMYCIINTGNEETVMAYRDKIEQEFGCKSIIVNNNSW
jgi:4-diphosphocytidyl-2-C-methyl-D-erythritol kinase